MLRPLIVETLNRWAVVINGNRTGFALDGGHGRAVFRTKTEANAFRKELKQHLPSTKCYVVKVEMTIKEVSE